MCLIIKAPAGVEIPEWIVASALSYNADGYGIMHNSPQGLPTMRKYTATTTGQVMADLYATRDIDRALHFRMATHGDVNRANAHPFRLADGSLLMHNGILSAYTQGADRSVSDTRRFIEAFINPSIVTSARDIAADTIEAEITGNALAILSADGGINLYGHGRWSEHYGASFSNEYAWDAPSKPKATRYARAPLAIDTGEFGYADALSFAEEDRHMLGDLILSEVYAVCESIDFTDFNLYASADSLLCEHYIAGTMTEYDLLDIVCGETLLAMYTSAIRAYLL